MKTLYWFIDRQSWIVIF